MYTIFYFSDELLKNKIPLQKGELETKIPSKDEFMLIPFTLRGIETNNTVTLWINVDFFP